MPSWKMSSQPPQGELHESYTVTIFLQHPLHSEGFRPILTETVYPLADGGPVALVRSRTIFHEFGPYPRWVVPAGRGEKPGTVARDTYPLSPPSGYSSDGFLPPFVDDLPLEIQSVGGDGARKQHLRDAEEPRRF